MSTKYDNVYDLARALLSERLVSADEPMSRHTSFRIGGPAEAYATPETIEQFTLMWNSCRIHKIPVTIMGDGCNVLVSDDGIKGLVISTRRMNSMIIDKDRHRIYADSGVKLSHLADAACKAGLGGLEFASGIPGTVGGAVYMNAGAFGREMKDVCHRIEAYKPNAGKTTYPNMDTTFSYRTSIFQTNDEIITHVVFQLYPDSPETIKATMTDLNTRRRNSQPLSRPSAGSTFKRPAVEGMYASKMIDDHGLKGYTIGGAQVSEKHAGFVINTGSATAADVLALIKHIQETIHNSTGIWLEPEVQMLGF